MPALESLLIPALLVAMGVALFAAGLGGFKLARRLASPQRDALRLIGELTPEALKQKPPTSPDRLARAALSRLWALTDPVIARQRQPVEPEGEMQPRQCHAGALVQ